MDLEKVDMEMVDLEKGGFRKGIELVLEGLFSIRASPSSCYTLMHTFIKESHTKREKTKT